MKNFLLISIGLLFIACSPDTTPVVLEDGKVINIVDNNDLHLLVDTVIVKQYTVRLHTDQSIYGIYQGNLPMNTFDYYVNARKDTVGYSIVYRKGVFLKR